MEFEVCNPDVNIYYGIRFGKVWWVRLKKTCHAIWGLVYRIFDLVLIISFENRRPAGISLCVGGVASVMTSCGCREYVGLFYCLTKINMGKQ